ncbi:hypothetical protein LIER_15965 [Lithospermum erythrorhizon]|uniref:Reverse transcriptase domain-containing protein n=1 Tax=Lithospermum erythrorhizon TaxID=34254 RepID=A0AAV3Q584_LITER
MAAGKSLRPDGLSSDFYEHHWEYIQGEIVATMEHSFASGRVPAWINATTLSLIPKDEVFNAYLISMSLSAFILGRNLGNSIMMLQELVQGYHVKDGVSKAAIKVDLTKAYDMVEWDSLWAVMEAMRFPQRFIGLLRACVGNVGFSININGTLKGWLSSIRGFRQGDPTL